MRGKLLALTAVCLLVFAGVANATINATVTIDPTQSYESAVKNYTIAILNPNVSVCSVNITTPGFTIINASPTDNWNAVHGTDWALWSTTTSCIDAVPPAPLPPGTSQGLLFKARANGVSDNSTESWIITLKDNTSTDSGTFIKNVTVYNDPQAPIVTLDSPADGANVSGNPALTCNATENNDLSNMTLFWNYTGTWTANDTYPVSGTSDQSIFSHPLTEDGTYTWNCYVCDVTDNCSFAPANYMFTTDITKPVVNLYSPLSQVYDTGILNLNYDASDNIARDECWFYNSSSNMNYTLTSCQNATLDLADGHYIIIVYANDSVNNINSDSVSFTVDLTDPSIALGSPINDYNSSSTSVTFDWTATDNLDTNPICSISIDGTLAASNIDSPNSTQIFRTLTVTEGNHNWNVTCWDDADRNATTPTLMFTVDTVDPIVDFILPSPANNTYLPVDYFTLNVNHTELHHDSIALFIDGAQMGTSSPYSGNYSNGTLINMSDDTYIYYIWLNDTTGNSAQTENRTITIDTTAPLVQFIPDTLNNDGSMPVGNNIYINVSHTEINPDSVILEVSGKPNETFSYMTENFTTITKSYPTGVYNYTVYVNDLAGNIDATEMRNVTFYVPPPPPPPSPGSTYSGGSGGYSASTCIEFWECTTWTAECVDFEYTRTCTDKNNCGTEEAKPADAIACALPDKTEVVPDETICTAGERKCSGSNIVECNSEETAWRLVTACEDGCQDALCKEPPVLESGGQAGLTGLFIGGTANILAVVAGLVIVIGGAVYWFRIRRFRVL